MEEEKNARRGWGLEAEGMQESDMYGFMEEDNDSGFKDLTNMESDKLGDIMMGIS